MEQKGVCEVNQWLWAGYCPTFERILKASTFKQLYNGRLHNKDSSSCFLPERFVPKKLEDMEILKFQVWEKKGDYCSGDKKTERRAL